MVGCESGVFTAAAGLFRLETRGKRFPTNLPYSREEAEAVFITVHKAWCCVRFWMVCLRSASSSAINANIHWWNPSDDGMH